MSIEFVTDSTAYLSRQEALDKRITVVPLQVRLDEAEYTEGFPGEYDSFFEKLKRAVRLPTTSQPSLGSFVTAFQEALTRSSQVIGVTLSSKLSGTYQTARMAADMVDPERIAVIDSRSGASAVRFMLENAFERARSGMAFEDLKAFVQAQAGRFPFRFTVASLEYLRKGGRLSNSQAILGSLLQFRPLIQVVEGAMVAVEKIRGQTKVVERMLADIPDGVRRISIVHVLNAQGAQGIAGALKARFPSAFVSVDEMGPVIGGQLGPGALGVCFDPGEGFA